MTNEKSQMAKFKIQSADDKGERLRLRLRLRRRSRLREDLSRAPKGVTLLGIVVQVPGANLRECLVTIFNKGKR